MAMAIATREDSCISEKDLELWPLDTFGNTVRNWCGLFVNVHDGKLSLIHQTAREFLTNDSKSARSSSDKWKGCLDIAAAHGTMSRICLSYLQFPNIASIDESQLKRDGHYGLMNEYHLLDYAVNHWANHYNSQPTEVIKDSLDAAKKLCNMPSAQGWFLFNCFSQDLNLRGWTNLGIAFYLGLVNVVEKFLDEGADGNAKCSPYGSAINTAIVAGRDRLVRMLLDKGADIHAQCGPIDENALQVASLYGHDQIVQMLLDKGADVNAQSGPFDENALQVASFYGHDQIVQMLLDKGADINAQGGESDSALNAASFQGCKHVVQMLLDNGASDVDGKALEEASWAGHDHIVRTLLKERRECYVQHNDHLNIAIAAASERGHDEVVRTLQEFQTSLE